MAVYTVQFIPSTLTLLDVCCKLFPLIQNRFEASKLLSFLLNSPIAYVEEKQLRWKQCCSHPSNRSHDGFPLNQLLSHVAEHLSLCLQLFGQLTK